MEDFSFPRLVIYWQPYLDHKQAWNLFIKTNKGDWTPEVSSFYSAGVISDISFLGDTTRNVLATPTKTLTPTTPTTVPTTPTTTTPPVTKIPNTTVPLSTLQQP